MDWTLMKIYAEPSVTPLCISMSLKSFQRKSDQLAWGSLSSDSLPVSSHHMFAKRMLANMEKATLILLQTAPMGFQNVGWKYYLVIICWSAFFIPGQSPLPSMATCTYLTLC